MLRIALWRSLKGHDLTYTGLPIYVFTLVEPLLAIVLACLPILSPLRTQFVNSSIYSWSKSLLRSTSQTQSSFHQMSKDESRPSLKSVRDTNRTLYPIQTETDIESHAMEDYQELVYSRSSLAAKGAIQITTDYTVSSKLNGRGN